MGRRSQNCVAAVLILGALATSACSTNAASDIERRALPAEQPDRVAGEYIVTLKAGIAEGDRAVREAYSEYGVVRVTAIGSRRYLVKLERDPEPAAVNRKMEQAPAIEAVQPNFRYRLQERYRSVPP